MLPGARTRKRTKTLVGSIVSIPTMYNDSPTSKGWGICHLRFFRLRNFTLKNKINLPGTSTQECSKPVPRRRRVFNIPVLLSVLPPRTNPPGFQRKFGLRNLAVSQLTPFPSAGTKFIYVIQSPYEQVIFDWQIPPSVALGNNERKLIGNI